jgi:uncharacterized phiE125 gp8 family phage protein
VGTFVVVKPTTEPVSVGEARSHLRLDTSDTDALLAGYLLAARMHAENHCRRVFMSQTWDTTFDYDWPQIKNEYRLDFPFGPVRSITQVTYTDEDDVVQTLASTDYLLRGTGEDNLPYIVPAYDVTWPTVLDIPETIRVRFVAGYGTNPGDVPEPIRNAILLHTELLYDRNPQSRSLLEDARDSLLDPYRIARV